MNVDLNYDFVGDFKHKYTTKLVEENIEKGESISGKQILKLTPSRQLNLFVIKILFQEWQDEMKQLESPYFDYKDPVVRKAMVEFMNVLSQHINVKDEDLIPLLEKAYDEVILLHLDPAGYLELELKDRPKAELSTKLIKQLTKYLVVFKDEMNEFLEGVKGDPIGEVIEKARYYFEGHDSRSYFEDLIESFSDTVEVSLSDFLAKEDETASEEETEETHETEVAAINAESDTPESENKPLSTYDEEETEDLKNEVREEVISNIPPGEDEDIEDESTLNKKYEVEAKTLADMHEEKKIDSIMEAISINHRYMFLQELFDGDNDQFQKAIREVETCGSFDEAVELLVQNYAKDYFWDMNSDEVKELLKVIFRRFRN